MAAARAPCGVRRPRSARPSRRQQSSWARTSGEAGGARCLSDIQQQTGERLADFVVKFPGDGAALLLLGLHHLGGEGARFGFQPHHAPGGDKRDGQREADDNRQLGQEHPAELSVHAREFRLTAPGITVHALADFIRDPEHIFAALCQLPAKVGIGSRRVATVCDIDHQVEQLPVSCDFAAQVCDIATFRITGHGAQRFGFERPQLFQQRDRAGVGRRGQIITRQGAGEIDAAAQLLEPTTALYEASAQRRFAGTDPAQDDERRDTGDRTQQQ